MKHARPAVFLAAAAAICAVALPSQAAAPKTQKLYFDSQPTPGTTGCNPLYVLVKTTPSGAPCGKIEVGYNGAGGMVFIPPTGKFGNDDYNSLPSSTGFKLDAKRALTGTVYIKNVPIASGTPVTAQGGPAGANVTIKINGVKVGTASGSAITQPNSSYALKVNMKLPASLNGKVIRSVEAFVQYNSGFGVEIVSNTSDARSALVFPTK